MRGERLERHCSAYLEVRLDDFRQQRILLLLDEKLIEQFERGVAQLDPVAAVMPEGLDVFALRYLIFGHQGLDAKEIVFVRGEDSRLQVGVLHVGHEEPLRFFGVIFLDQVEVHVNEERVD